MINSKDRIGLRAATGAAALMATTFGCQSARAQSVAVVPPEAVNNGADQHSDGLADIIVTARRRAETKQDIPESVSVVGGDFLKKANVQSLDKLSLYIPNLNIYVSQNPGQPFVNVRGIQQIPGNDAPVAFVVDGVLATSPNQLTQMLVGVERVEVLKGPQGAIYGRNAIGGAINVVTREPGNDFEGDVRARLANGPEYQIDGSASGALIADKVLLRIDASYRNDDGRIKNVTLDRKVDYAKESTVRGRLLLKPSEALKIDLRASHVDLSKAGTSYFAPVYQGDGNHRNPIELNYPDTGSNRSLEDFSAKMDLDLGFATLSSVTARSIVKDRFAIDLDFLSATNPIAVNTARGLAGFLASVGAPFTPAFISTIVGETAAQQVHTRAITQELRLSSSGNTRLTWEIGAYYAHIIKDLGSHAGFDTGAGAAGALFIINRSTRETTNVPAVFGFVEYEITHGLKLNIAGRYDWDHRTQTDLFGLLPVAHAKFDKFQPKASLTYLLAPDKRLYVSAGRGFRSGGFNAINPGSSFQRIYQPDVADTYEAGIKTEWLNRRLQANLSGFYMNYDKPQSFLFDPASGQQIVYNLGKARVYGVEGDVTFQLTRQLRVSANGGAFQSKILSAGTIPFPNISAADIVGSHLPGNNHWSGSISANYEVPISDDTKFIAQADVNAFGKLYWYPTSEYKRGSSGLVNARIGVERGRWSLFAYVENLTGHRYDVQYVASKYDAFPTDIATPSQPRRFGLIAEAKF